MTYYLPFNLAMYGPSELLICLKLQAKTPASTFGKTQSHVARDRNEALKLNAAMQFAFLLMEYYF